MVGEPATESIPNVENVLVKAGREEEHCISKRKYKMKNVMLILSVAGLMTACVFTRPSQVLVWRSNSSLMATEGKTATITKGDEGNSVNADKTSSSDAKAVVSGTGPATDTSTDNSSNDQSKNKDKDKEAETQPVEDTPLIK